MDGAYLISYDISDDKRRNKVFERLMDIGDHLQYSLFVCELSQTEHIELKTQLSEIIHCEKDQVMLLRVGPRMDNFMHAVECIGQPYHPRCPVQVV